MPARSRRIDQQRCEPLHPAVDGHVIDVDTTLGQQFFDVSVESPKRRYQRAAKVITSGGTGTRRTPRSGSKRRYSARLACIKHGNPCSHPRTQQSRCVCLRHAAGRARCSPDAGSDPSVGTPQWWNLPTGRELAGSSRRPAGLGRDPVCAGGAGVTVALLTTSPNRAT